MYSELYTIFDTVFFFRRCRSNRTVYTKTVSNITLPITLLAMAPLFADGFGGGVSMTVTVLVRVAVGDPFEPVIRGNSSHAVVAPAVMKWIDSIYFEIKP